MKETIPTESVEQATLVAWLKRSHPSLRMFSIPNGAHLAGSIAQRSKQVQKLKLQGMEPGVCDLMLPCARKGYHGLFIEMKRKKGGTTSSEQKEWIQYLSEQGYKAEVCKGWESARDLIIEYLS